MHKMKDGEKIELSQEELDEIRAYQKIMKDEEDAQLKAFRDKQDLKKNVLKKIQSGLGLSEDEINILM